MIAPFRSNALYHDPLAQIVAPGSRHLENSLLASSLSLSALNATRSSSFPTLDSVKSLSCAPTHAPSINTRVAQLLEIEAKRSAILASLSPPRPSPWLVDGVLGLGPATTRQRPVSLLELQLQRQTNRHSLGQLSAVISQQTKADNNLSLSQVNVNVALASTSGRERLYVDDALTNDVLCGRGGRSNHHPGNKRYRQVVSDMKASYRNIGSKSAKTDLSKAIVDHVIGYGGRFLKFEKATGKYCILTPAEARKKTSQALREAKDVKWTS